MQHGFLITLFHKIGINVPFICKRSHATNLPKNFGVIGMPSKACEMISSYNKNILINLTVKEIKQHVYREY